MKLITEREKQKSNKAGNLRRAVCLFLPAALSLLLLSACGENRPAENPAPAQSTEEASAPEGASSETAQEADDGTTETAVQPAEDAAADAADTADSAEPAASTDTEKPEEEDAAEEASGTETGTSGDGGEDGHDAGDASGGSTAEQDDAAQEGTAGEAATEDGGDPPAEAVSGDIRGVLDGQTYRNGYMGFSVTLPDSYRYADEEALSTLNGLAPAPDNEMIREAMERLGTLVVCDARTPDNMKTISIGVQDASLIGRLMKTETLLEAARSLTVQELEGMGITDITSETQDTTFLGNDAKAMVISGKVGDNSFYERIVILHKGDYFCAVTAGSAGEDVTQELLGYFRSLE